MGRGSVRWVCWCALGTAFLHVATAACSSDAGGASDGSGGASGHSGGHSGRTENDGAPSAGSGGAGASGASSTGGARTDAGFAAGASGSGGAGAARNDAGPDGSADGGSTTGSFDPTGSGAWHFDNVRIGGGGYVTGVIIEPASGIMYVRTDVGGAYRFDAANARFVPLLDWVTNGARMSVASIAVRPGDANTVAVLAGPGAPTVLYSEDRGASFREAIDAPTAASDWPSDSIDGNSRDGRWGGERLLIAKDGTL